MRHVLTGLLSVMLCMGCGDDDDGTESDAGRGSADASTRDATFSDSDPTSGDAGPTRDDTFQNNRAIATLESKSGSMVTGSAQFTSVGGLVTLSLTVAGAEPGERGVHLHVKGDCSAADATSAGGHWNPEMHPHGAGPLDAGALSHLGDLGNITIGMDKTGNLTVSNPAWTLGDGLPTDVVGKAIIVHKNTDDLVTQENMDAGISPGNAGARLACGVVRK